jgi:hypothetical protein
MPTATREPAGVGTIAPGLYRATSPLGDSIELLVEWRDGVLRGSTAESADRRRRGYQEGPGVAVVDLVGWRFERLGDPR